MEGQLRVVIPKNDDVQKIIKTPRKRGRPYPNGEPPPLEFSDKEFMGHSVIFNPKTGKPRCWDIGALRQLNNSDLIDFIDEINPKSPTEMDILDSWEKHFINIKSPYAIIGDENNLKLIKIKFSVREPR